MQVVQATDADGIAAALTGPEDERPDLILSSTDFLSELATRGELGTKAAAGSRPLVVALKPLDDIGCQYPLLEGLVDVSVLRPASVETLKEALREVTGRGSQAPVPSLEGEGAETGHLDAVKVLVVDDNKTNRRLIEVFLAREGVQFSSADDGVSAIAAYQDQLPHLVLMDVSMPTMNGLEATENIRVIEAQNRWPRSRVIGLTAHSSAEDREACLQSGMDAHMAKPVSLKSLRAELADIAQDLQQSVA